MTDIVLNDLTTANVAGTGVFDVLMRATKAHLEEEYTKNRIKGAEYSTVYLGALDNVMSTALQFLMSNQKANLEAKLLEQQIILAEVEVIKANAIVEQTKAQTELLGQQLENTKAELDIIKANALKVPAEIDQLHAQTELTKQQKTNLVDNLLTQEAERDQARQQTLNLVKQGELVEQQKTNLIDELQTATIQRNKLIQETSNLKLQEAAIEASTAQTKAETLKSTQELSNLASQDAQIKAQTSQAVQQTSNLVSTGLQIKAQTALVTQQEANAVIEGTVLTAQACKLKAEFDLTKGNTLKTAQETSLLSQKTATERAQTTAVGVDADSVIGRQKGLYVAQTDGFKRDAEQKGAKILVDSWNVRRTTDEATVADGTNMLNDATVGRAVTALMRGIGA